MAFQAGAIVSQLTLDRSKFSASMKVVQKQTRRLSGWVKQNSAQFKRMGLVAAAAGTAALAVFTKMVKKYVEVGDTIHKMALRTGFAATTLSELAYAADISGADLAMLEKGVKRMARTITDAGEGLESYLRPLRRIGLEVEELQRMNPEQQFLAIAEAIGELEDPTLRAATAQEIFGRAGTMLLPLMAEGKEGMQALREEAHRLGIIFDEETAANAAKLKDAQTALTGSIQGLSIAILNDLIPVLTDLTKEFTDFFVTSRKDAKGWTNAILDFFKLVAKGVEGLALAWHGMQVIVFKGAEFIVKAIKFQIDAITAPLKLLAKLPGVAGAPARAILKAVAKHTADLTAISEEYNKAAEDQINKITNIIVKYEKFVTTLDKIKTKTKEAEKELEGFGETVVETIARPITLGPLAINIPKMSLEDFKEFYEKWLGDLKEKWKKQWEDTMYWSQYFVSQLGNIFNQLSQNQIINIENEYEARRKAIENSIANENTKAKAIEKLDKEFEKRRIKAMRAQAARTKVLGVMEAIINTAAAVVEALPDIPLAVAVGIIGAAQTALIAAQPLPTFQRGGRIGEGEPGIVGERGKELFVPDTAGTIVPLREAAPARGLGGAINIITELYMQTIDAESTRDFMRNQGLYEIVEAIKVGIMKPELQDALRIK